jgi:hypothetical protein
MKFIKLKTLAAMGIIGVVSALVSTPSYALTRVNQAFTKAANPGYILLSVIPGTARFGTLSSNFPTGTLNLSKTIDSVTYTATSYTNGALRQDVRICMTRQYSTVIDVCQNITGAPSGTVQNFVGKVIAPGIDFFIEHTLTGGSYPTTTPITKDQIIVNYHYFQ